MYLMTVKENSSSHYFSQNVIFDIFLCKAFHHELLYLFFQKLKTTAWTLLILQEYGNNKCMLSSINDVNLRILLLSSREITNLSQYKIYDLICALAYIRNVKPDVETYWNKDILLHDASAVLM